jgi:PhnB protein
MGNVKSLPANSSMVIPMLVCRNVAAQIQFCKMVFPAIELGRRPGPDGNAAHSLLTINGGMIILEAEWPSLASRAPQQDGSSPVVIFVYVEDVDAVMERAVTAGAKILFPPKNQFWGDRTARMIDPEGHVWTVASRIEESTASERETRWSEILKS